MKKKLEADLISIAHRVLQMKNKSDINQLCNETRKLYEKLAILQFVEEHFEGVKPTIGQAEIVEKMKQFFKETHLSEIQPSKILEEVVVDEVAVEEIEEETIEEEIVAEEVVADEIEEVILEEEVVAIEEEEISVNEEANEIGFKPAFELDEEEEEIIEEPSKNKTKDSQISFLDLLGNDYTEPMFVKVDQTENKPSPPAFDIAIEEDFISENLDSKSVSLNEKLSKGINVDLNDRIAFVKHLFGNSDEDYTRVMNQIITYDSFDEVKDFIEDMVKPDYDNWDGKEDYAQRFVEILEKKFA